MIRRHNSCEIPLTQECFTSITSSRPLRSARDASYAVFISAAQGVTNFPSEDRGRAFDNWELAEQRRLNIRAIASMKRRHAEIGELTQQRALQRLNNMTEDEINKLPPAVVARFLEVGAKLESAALGEVDDEAQVRQIHVHVNLRRPQTAEEAELTQRWLSRPAV